MKRILVFFSLIVVFNIIYANEFDKKIEMLQKEKLIKIEGDTAYIKIEKWLKLSVEERINFLEKLNKSSRKMKKKNIIIIKEFESEKKLAEIGLFGVELIDEEKQSPD